MDLPEQKTESSLAFVAGKQAVESDRGRLLLIIGVIGAIFGRLLERWLAARYLLHWAEGFPIDFLAGLAIAALCMLVAKMIMQALDKNTELTQ